jgi:hypothetical protein
MSLFLKFTKPISLENGTEINDLNEYLNVILSTLNITEQTIIDEIKKPFEKYATEAYQILSNDSLQEQIKTLLNADSELQILVKDGGELKQYYDSDDGELKQNWDNTMHSLARLQGLIIVRKAAKESTKGCVPIINKLVVALANKIDASNKLLELEL